MVFDIIVLLVGVVVGWAVPQPDFVKQLFDMVKERLKASSPATDTKPTDTETKW